MKTPSTATVLRPFLVLSLLLVLLPACGGEASAGKDLAHRGGSILAYSTATPEEGAGSLAVDPQASAHTGRKLVYTATMRLHVESYPEPARRLRDLVKEARGYVVNVREWHHEGRPSAGEWRIRVPAQGLDSFLDRVGGFGAVQSRGLESDDVTSTWADLERRAEIARKIETRYLELLATAKTDLEQTLALEEKLIRVRSEIETLEGSRRELAEVVRYATVNLELHSLVRSGGSRLGLGEEAGAAWKRSLAGIVTFGRALVIGLVVSAPWLAMLLPLATWLYWRRRWRRAQ